MGEARKEGEAQSQLRYREANDCGAVGCGCTRGALGTPCRVLGVFNWRHKKNGLL